MGTNKIWWVTTSRRERFTTKFQYRSIEHASFRFPLRPNECHVFQLPSFSNNAITGAYVRWYLKFVHDSLLTDRWVKNRWLFAVTAAKLINYIVYDVCWANTGCLLVAQFHLIRGNIVVSALSLSRHSNGIPCGTQTRFKETYRPLLHPNRNLHRSYARADSNNNKRTTHHRIDWLKLIETRQSVAKRIICAIEKCARNFDIKSTTVRHFCIEVDTNVRSSRIKCRLCAANTTTPHHNNNISSKMLYLHNLHLYFRFFF